MALPATTDLVCPNCQTPLRKFAPKSFQFGGCSNCGTFSDFSGDLPKIINRNYSFNTNWPTMAVGRTFFFDGKHLTVYARLQKKMLGQAVEWIEYLVIDKQNRFYIFAQTTNGILFSWPCEHEMLFTEFNVHQDQHLHEKGFELAANYVMIYQAIDGFVEQDLTKLSSHAHCKEYESGDQVLLCEEYQGEILWFEGYYLDEDQEDIFEGYCEGSAERIVKRKEEYQAIQDKHVDLMKTAFFFGLLLMIFWFWQIKSHPTVVVLDRYFANESADSIYPSNKSSNLRTEDFVIQGPTGVSIQFFNRFTNTWKEFDGTLVNKTTGTTYPFSALAEHYSGYQDGESWNEGENEPTVKLNGVESGTYHLNIQWFSEGLDFQGFTVQIRQNEAWTSNLYLVLIAIFAYPIFYYYFNIHEK